MHLKPLALSGIHHVTVTSATGLFGGATNLQRKPGSFEEFSSGALWSVFSGVLDPLTAGV
jgi:hypothetical protein